MRNKITKDLSPEKYVFIIDSISSAFALATWASKKSIKCIYECKQIDWRKADYVKLFDIILSDVKMSEKVLVEVPHPYFLHTTSILETVKNQRSFIKKVFNIFPLNPRMIYCSCSTSSILIANKNRVIHLLIDEGMGSVIARNRSKGATKWLRFLDAFKKNLAEIIFPFRFKNSVPQITLTNDNHPSAVLHLDYRQFNSHLFEIAIEPLVKKTNEFQCNILVLVKGPSDSGGEHVKEGQWNSGIYIDFNIDVIRRFMEIAQIPKGAMFYLKTHPSLGKCPAMIDELVSSLAILGIEACGVSSLIEFEESSSLPAEGLLRYGKFQYLLASDVSSSLWNIAHFKEVICYSPLEAVIKLVKIENSPHEKLYRYQYELNRIMGGFVNFF